MVSDDAENQNERAAGKPNWNRELGGEEGDKMNTREWEKKIGFFRRSPLKDLGPPSTLRP